MTHITDPQPYTLGKSLAYIIDVLGHKNVGIAALVLGYLRDDHHERYGTEGTFYLARAMNFFRENFFVKHNNDKIIFKLSFPSPSGHEIDGHTAMLIVDRPARRIDYQDAYGILMPKPLRTALMSTFEDYEIINHRVVQQVEGALSCGVYALENTLCFAENRMLADTCDHRYYRLRHAAKLEIFSDEEKLASLLNTHKEQIAVFKIGVKRDALKPGAEHDGCIALFWDHAFPHIAAASLPAVQNPPTSYRPPYRKDYMDERMLGILVKALG